MHQAEETQCSVVVHRQEAHGEEPQSPRASRSLGNRVTQNQQEQKVDEAATNEGGLQLHKLAQLNCRK